jgi:hypothetical protein
VCHFQKRNQKSSRVRKRVKDHSNHINKAFKTHQLFVTHPHFWWNFFSFYVFPGGENVRLTLLRLMCGALHFLILINLQHHCRKSAKSRYENPYLIQRNVSVGAEEMTLSIQRNVWLTSERTKTWMTTLGPMAPIFLYAQRWDLLYSSCCLKLLIGYIEMLHRPVLVISSSTARETLRFVAYNSGVRTNSPYCIHYRGMLSKFLLTVCSSLIHVRCPVLVLSSSTAREKTPIYGV